MTKKIGENTMKDLLSVINNKKIQNMMCNQDVLNSLGEKPDMNKLMDCQDLHNVISDRDLMSQIFDLSKVMGSSSSDKVNNIVQQNVEDKTLSSDYQKYTFNETIDKSTDYINQEDILSNKTKELDISNKKVLDEDEQYYTELNKLSKMGYQDISKNKQLLEKHNGDIIPVLKELL